MAARKVNKKEVGRGPARSPEPAPRLPSKGAYTYSVRCRFRLRRDFDRSELTVDPAGGRTLIPSEGARTRLARRLEEVLGEQWSLNSPPRVHANEPWEVVGEFKAMLDCYTRPKGAKKSDWEAFLLGEALLETPDLMSLEPRRVSRLPRQELDRIQIHDKIEFSTSLVKTAVLLGLVASLVGGIAASPVAVKAYASVKVTVEAKASVNVGVGKAKAKPKAQAKTAAKSKAVAEKTTKARIAKGTGTMRKTSINVKKSVWKKASSLAGE